MIGCMDLTDVFLALSNKHRQHIVESLKDPERHYRPNEPSVDMTSTGVCVSQVSEHLDVTAATASQYLAQLKNVGILSSERLGKFTFYRRNEGRIAEITQAITEQL